jgi:site-specific recombinase XerD
MATTGKKRRSKGAGGIIKLASGFYAYQYVDAKGARRTKSLRTKSKAEAETRAKEHEKAVHASDREEVLMQSAKARRIIQSRELPLADVWGEFMETGPTAGPGTLGLYRRALDEFTGWLAEERPGMVSFTQVDLGTAISYMESVWSGGVSASTYNDKRNALGHIAKKLANRFGIESNPWLRTERKRGVKQTRLPLTRQQVTDLLERVDDPKGLAYPEETRVLVHLCLFAGMRLTDAVHLKWPEVNLLASAIRYTPAKTARTSGVVAQVPILPPLHNCLSVLPREEEQVLPKVAAHYDRNPDYIKVLLLGLIHGVTGSEKQDAKAQHQRARSQYGAHSLRHTFATEAARAGVPPAYLSLMTGDTLQTLQRFYVKVGYAQAPVSGFESIPGMIEGKEETKPIEPEREQLRKLVDALPIEAVKELLASIQKALPAGA